MNENVVNICKRVLGYSIVFPYDALLRRYGRRKCGSNLIYVEDVDEKEEEDNLIPRQTDLLLMQRLLWRSL